MERDSSLAALLEQALADTAEGEPLPETARRQVLAMLERTGALADCRRLAHEQVAEAIAHLDALPDGHAKTALITVAEATIHREA
jgi:octaprenyl-diphosphate synthase